MTLGVILQLQNKVGSPPDHWEAGCPSLFFAALLHSSNHPLSLYSSPAGSPLSVAVPNDGQINYRLISPS